MSKWDDVVQRHRRPLLAAVMGFILLASTGLAAWVAWGTVGSVPNAAEVLAHIRKRSLRAFWGDREVTRWYVLRGPGGEAVGWWMARREPTAAGYAGQMVYRTGESLAKAAWQVDEAARTSSYRSDVYQLVPGPGVRRAVPQRESRTTIQLRDGRVEVRRVDPRGAYAAAGMAPANYIPEDLSELAFYLATAGERDATFTMVLDEGFRARDGSLAFAQASLRPSGPREARVVLIVGRPAGTELLRFDTDGKLIRKELGRAGLWYELSEFDTVLKHFPDAMLFAKPEEEPAPETDAAERP